MGLIISIFALEYDGWKYILVDGSGEVEVVNDLDLDFNLITNTFLIMVGSGIFIYLMLVVVKRLKKPV
ncbi:hypothetical protein V6B33_01695 [Mangrovibacillus sp. Mu-81]|uniref:hypothetical protein n=1 Tax=Mangrovibacillus sp. Mu-81 TaxID=3121478 RepID=UPI002FE4B26F